MKKTRPATLLVPFLFLLLFSGCTTTFFGTVLILTFKDIITYVGMALVMAVLSTFFTTADSRTTFWICFLLSLVLTPLAGLIYLLVLITKKTG